MRCSKRSTRYYTLEETAGVIVDDAVVRSFADAGAILVPDGDVWRVAAGVAIRPLEHRLQLTQESWLVENVASAGKGIIIEDSDVARENLRGSPLASRPTSWPCQYPRFKPSWSLPATETSHSPNEPLVHWPALRMKQGHCCSKRSICGSLARIVCRDIVDTGE